MNLNQDELESLQTIVKACVDSEENVLPVWNYMGQDVWQMDFEWDAPDTASKWGIEVVDVA